MNAGSMLLLLLAILSEVAGTVALKASEGFARLGPTVLVVVGYGLTFYCKSSPPEMFPGAVFSLPVSVVGSRLALRPGNDARPHPS